MVKVFRFAGLFFVQSLLCVGFQRITALRAISLIGLRGKGSENQVMMVMLVQGKCRLLPQRPLVWRCRIIVKQLLQESPPFANGLLGPAVQLELGLRSTAGPSKDEALRFGTSKNVDSHSGLNQQL